MINFPTYCLTNWMTENIHSHITLYYFICIDNSSVGIINFWSQYKIFTFLNVNSCDCYSFPHRAMTRLDLSNVSINNNKLPSDWRVTRVSSMAMRFSSSSSTVNLIDGWTVSKKKKALNSITLYFGVLLMRVCVVHIEILR